MTGATVKDALNTLLASIAALPPATRNLIAGNGLTGGGDLSADRTFNVVGNADGSIVANANDVQVGVLATDAQHGVRGGGTQHAVATTSVAGFESAADKTKLDGIAAGAQVNTVTSVFTRTGAVVAAASDYDASQVDNDSSVTGATVKDALNTLLAAIPGGGTLQSVYTAAGLADLTVTGANPWKLRAADNTTDVLMQLLRDVGGGEISKLKAPDATATTSGGTPMQVLGGNGKAATGSGNASDAGYAYLLGGTGATSVNGQAGGGGNAFALAGPGGAASGSGNGRSGGNARMLSGVGGATSGAGTAGDGGTAELLSGAGGATTVGQAGAGGALNVKTGNGGAASGTAGQPGDSGSIVVKTGNGGNSNDATVSGGYSGAIDIDVGAFGTSPGGDSFAGVAGNITIGAVNAPRVDVGRLGSQFGAIGTTMFSGAVSPVGNVIGNPGDYYLRQSTTSSGLWQHVGASADNTSWRKVLDTNGGKLSGPLDTTPTAQSFSATPTFDVGANDDFSMAALTADIAITLSNPAVGKSGQIAVVQDGTGGRKITGITVSGFTVRCFNAGALVNTPEFLAASARSVLTYKMYTVNSVQICAVWVDSDGNVAADFS